jgi:hypothetical protein
LQPTRSVTIGSELSGTVRKVLVDVNDKVKKGQVLVELDTAKLEAQVLRSRASLARPRRGWRRPWPPPKRPPRAWRGWRKWRACRAARCRRPNWMPAAPR